MHSAGCRILIRFNDGSLRSERLCGHTPPQTHMCSHTPHVGLIEPHYSQWCYPPAMSNPFQCFNDLLITQEKEIHWARMWRFLLRVCDRKSWFPSCCNTFVSQRFQSDLQEGTGGGSRGGLQRRSSSTFVLVFLTFNWPREDLPQCELNRSTRCSFNCCPTVVYVFVGASV